MAPKKSLLVLTAALLLTGLTFAQDSTQNTIDDVPDKVWLNEDPEIEFQVTFDPECDSDEQVTVNDEELEPSEVEEEDGVYNYTFSDFEDPEVYNIVASCTDEPSDAESEPTEIEDEVAVKAGLLQFEMQDTPSDTIYEGGDFEGRVKLQVEGNVKEPEVNYEYKFDKENDRTAITLEDGGFRVEASDSGFESVEVFATSPNFDFELHDSADVDIQDVWQIKDLSVSANEKIDDDDYTVKYRNLDQLQLDFKVTRKGEGESGFGSSDFMFDGEENWFSAEDNGGGDYTLNIDGRPVMDELDVNDQERLEVVLSDEKLDSDLELAEITVEKDVSFSGRVLDVRNNRVDTSFETIYNGRVRTFQTDDSGYFEKYINTDTVDMIIDFPEASVSLDELQVNKEDPGDISYNYYDSIDDSNIVSENLPAGVRPVNLAAFISNYNFNGESLDTFAKMEFDTSEIRPEDVVVYECNEWTFRAEECSGDWEKIDNKDVTLESGAIWDAEFPITPRESERFSGDEGVLSNAFLVGVPEGVGSELTLEDSLDVESSRIASGGSFKASGRVIDGTTGQAVEDADVDLKLSGPEYVEFEVSTDSNGEFEVSGRLDEAGSYDVTFLAVKSPYQGFEKKQSEAVEVFYETGLSVSSESSPEVTLGEDYNIEYTIENTGQAPAEDIEFEVSGIDESDYDLNPSSISSLDEGESADVVLTLNLDEDLRTPPTISFEAAGVSDGEDVTAGPDTTSVSFSDDVNLGRNDDNDDKEDSTETEKTKSSSLPSTEEISRATGEFIESQSDMNLALGLIFVFGAVLAVAVRKQKNNGGDRDRMSGRMNGRMAGDRGRGRVQKPQVAPEKVEPEELEDDEEENESAETDDSNDEEPNESKAEDEDSDDEDGDFTCDTCGESFDTESGLNLHEQALH